MMVFVPSLNVEYDYRRISRALDAAREKMSVRRITLRAAASMIGAGAMIAVIVAMA